MPKMTSYNLQAILTFDITSREKSLRNSRTDSYGVGRGDSMILTFHVPPLAEGQGL